jgi:iron complex outermembrane receptor protein
MKARLQRPPANGLLCALVITALVGVAASSTALAQATAELAADDPAALGAAPPAGDEFDSLLQLAEQDVSQLTEVKVSQRIPTLDTEVSTVSRAPSTVGKSPAAVFVITPEMIRRSGARSIPEVLRMAPGVNVARIDSNKWAVTIRGFNSRYANKLLVQIDGRTIYTPLFSGVIWESQDVLLEDVERIEVIRGPGASVWGANAVNGVINIITKRAGDTQGAYGEVGGGTYEQGFVSGRYGGQVGNDVDYRIWGKAFERGTGVPPAGVDPFDSWRGARAGFRMDWNPGRCDTDLFTLQGDAYETMAGSRNTLPSLAPPFSTTADSDAWYRGSNILGRWTHTIDNETEWQLQAYYDFTQIDAAQVLSFVEDRDTVDLDFQYRQPLGERQKLVWGMGYRLTADDLTYAPIPLAFTEPRQTIQMGSFFLQDEIALVPDLWTATLGSKFLYNTYTNFEYQPTARLLYTPDQRQSLWAAASRAVRIPSRSEDSILATMTPTIPAPVFTQIVGNPELVSEDMIAYEAGYRAAPSDYFSWDAAVFFNQYENLVGYMPSGPQVTPNGIVIPLNLDNVIRAQSYGFELAATTQMTDCWELRGAYSYLQIEVLGLAPGTVGTTDAEGLSPVNQVYLQSAHDLGRGVELDLIGRYVDSLPAANVPSYIVGDVRLAWQYAEDVELFVVGRGLFDNGHYEFEGDEAIGGVPTGVRSEVYGGITIWR